jgi:methylated-DNA-protein-cysteine methyltransferase related protein
VGARPESRMAGGTLFREIWGVVARIPRGRVATYGQIARMAGLPGGARTVGWAMRALPDDLRISGRRVPWHRVINAQGRISPRGLTRDTEGSAEQALRLRREGVGVTRGGRIDLEQHLWGGSIGRAGRG